MSSHTHANGDASPHSAAAANGVEFSSAVYGNGNGNGIGNGNGAAAAGAGAAMYPSVTSVGSGASESGVLDPLTGQPVGLSAHNPDVATHNADGKGNECTLGGSPTFLEFGTHRFLIIDSPNDKNLPAYIDVLKRKHVVALCRACEPRYATDLLKAANIAVLDVPFPDGDPPPKESLEPWLDLVDATFARNTPDKPKEEKVAIAVHCVAGLGRAPALVACALVEHGMEPMDAIAFIRRKRRGAINARQIKWLESYQRTRAKGCCTIL